jgi:lysophospholipase L1-like esterase
MKTILCFGDSNTWGFNPVNGQRYTRDVRWPGVLRRALGHDYEVIEEGLRGRTTVFADPLEEHKSGKEYLPPCLQSHAPLDLVILLLGTNDIQARYAATAMEIALGVGALVELIQRSGTGSGGDAPDVLLLAPPPIAMVDEPFDEVFAGAEAKSRRFAAHFARMADLYQCAFYDTAECVVSGAIDGVHWEASEHEKLGKALAPIVRGLLEGG